MKKLLPFLVAALLAIATPTLAQDPLGKGGKGGGNSGGGSGGGQSGGGNSGGGAPPPPTRGGGGGGNSGGGNSQPPITNGGQNNGGGGLGKGGGGNSGGGNSGGSTGDPGNSGSPPVTGNGSRQEAPLGRSQGGGTSRSGSVIYQDNNNQISRTRTGQSFGAPPPIVRTDSRSSREAYAEDRIDRNRYRSGYYQYDNRWRDNWYWYPHYQFSYNPCICVPSPWYSYPNVPGYISVVRINYDWIQFEWATGSIYNWRYQNNNGNNGWGWSWGNNNRRSDLDYAVDDIYDAFRKGSIREMDGLIGNGNTWISVEVGRNSGYRLRGDDFYDMLRDVVEGTWTLDYRIREVRESRGRATIVADHVYRDPWGRQRTSRHYYGLEQGRRGYEIVAFRIDD